MGTARTHQVTEKPQGIGWESDGRLISGWKQREYLEDTEPWFEGETGTET